MSEQVKRYDPINIDGTCGICVEEPDYGAYVEFADYAALEAECDRLRVQVSALQSDANSWQSGYDKGREDGAKTAEGWKAQNARDSAELRKLCAARDALHAEAEGLRKRARTAERQAAQALRTLKGLEKVARVVDANSDEVCGENNRMRQEVDALRVALHGIASVNPAERGIEWAKSYASDGLKGSGSELYARWLDTFKEAEALRAENSRLRDKYDRDVYGLNNEGDPIGGDPAGGYANDNAKLRAELEEALVLLRESREAYSEAIHWEDQQPVMKKIAAFLTATPAPEARCNTCDGAGDVHRTDGEWLGSCHCANGEQAK